MNGPFAVRAQSRLPTLYRSFTTAKNGLQRLTGSPRSRVFHSTQLSNSQPRVLLPSGELIRRLPLGSLTQTCRFSSGSRHGDPPIPSGTVERNVHGVLISRTTGQPLKGRMHAIDMPESLPRVQRTPQERKEAVEALDQYLIDLESELTPSMDFLEMTEDAIERLDRNVTTYLRTFTPILDVYGSYLSGLYTEGSDLDLTLTGSTGSLGPDDVVAMLRYYHYKSVRVSRPMNEFVAQFIDPVTGIQCDLCLNQRLAVQNSLMIGTYIKLDPRLRPLIYGLKRMVGYFGISGSRHHISNYAYTMWVIAFLQMQDPPILPKLQPPPPPLIPAPTTPDSSSPSPYPPPPMRVDPATLEKTVEINGRTLDRVIIEGHDCTFDDDWQRYVPNTTATANTTNTNISSASSTSPPARTTGDLLLSFFEYFGFEHDYVQRDLHTRTATFEPRPYGVYPLGKFPSPRLRLLDPFLLDRDLGAGARIHGAMRIREAFQHSANSILEGNLQEVFGDE